MKMAMASLRRTCIILSSLFSCGYLQNEPFVSARGSFKRRPTVAQKLIDSLFLGNDPMDAPSQHSADMDVGMTHVSGKDISMVLSHCVQPVTFWLELGAFEGGSAILTAKNIKAKTGGGKKGVTAPATSVVAVDTFLGDLRVLWERQEEERRTLLRPDGTINLYDRFRENVRKAGHADVILPLPATSIVALRLFTELAARGEVPAPQVIYLDSAHEEGEVLLELELAWRLVAPGGIVFGDDWVLPPQPGHTTATDQANDEGGVQRDVLRFAENYEAELDDTLGPVVRDMRTLGRARPGLFVSYNSFQWFMRKLPDADIKRRAKTTTQSKLAGSAGVNSAAKAPGPAFDCWTEGYGASDCCDEERFGPGGNAACWDLMFTFDRCCHSGR
eukprot:TRINITY_DN23231_c0_g3_i1.p1 TRINITY_DN23231_c0_g3~~TRINITY_DN23231_c0_g3_i1.p1  ORF type:complete len:388 (-),score=59.31 TRINITY_DN23231_c0_g3_i1:75-1238(-)